METVAFTRQNAADAVCFEFGIWQAVIVVRPGSGPDSAVLSHYTALQGPCPASRQIDRNVTC